MTEQPTLITCQMNITPRDFRAFVRCRNWWVNYIWLYIIIIVLFVPSLILDIISGNSSSFNTIITINITLYLMIFLVHSPLAQYNQNQTTFCAQRSYSFHETYVSAELNRPGFNQISHTDYSAYSHVIETKRAIYLFVRNSNTEGVILVKSQLEPEQADYLRGFFSYKFGRQFRGMKL